MMSITSFKALLVIPAEAGGALSTAEWLVIQRLNGEMWESHWIPAFAGMTNVKVAA